MTTKEYRDFLIEGILDYQQGDKFTRKSLESKPIRTLERIYDNI